MRIETSVFLIIKSHEIEPGEITRVTGLTPDMTSTKHSREVVGSVKVPKSHLWRIDSGLDVHQRVEAHLEALATRVGMSAERIGGIVDERTKCYMTIVRRFYLSSDPAAIGFGIDRSILALLSRLKADIDIDEYDYTVE